MNFVLRTAHAEEKKKGGHTNPNVRTIIIIIIIIIIHGVYEKSQMCHPCGARFARPIMLTSEMQHCQDYIQARGQGLYLNAPPPAT